MRQNLITNAYKKTYEIAAKKRLDFFIKSDGKNYPVLLDDILYCEAMKNYRNYKMKIKKI